MFKTPNNRTLLLYVLLFLIIIYFPIFLHLDAAVVRLWDESRLVENTLEMISNKNYLVTYYDNAPDMWNTKPPFAIWLQLISVKCFGINETSFRLPSAIAGFLTCILLLVFSIKYLQKFWFGFIAALILVTSFGYINYHVSRTADYDSLLVLFLTSYALMFFLFIEHKNTKYLHFFYVALTLAVLTKSIQGLLFLPAIAVYFFIKFDIKVIRNKWLYIDFLVFVFCISSYYLLRENYNPGYLKAVWENELGGRYLNTLENHQAPFMFYFDMLKEHHYKDWMWMLPIGALFGFFSKNKKLKNITLFSFVIVVSYWLIISNAKTKIEWYEAPLFTFMALLISPSIYFFFEFLSNKYFFGSSFKLNLKPLVFLVLVFFVPYRNIVAKVYYSNEYEWDRELYSMSYFLRDAINVDNKLQNHFICYKNYSAQLLLYIRKLNDLGRNVAYKECEKLEVGDLAISVQPEVKKYISENYFVSEIEKTEFVVILKIDSIKSTNK